MTKNDIRNAYFEWIYNLVNRSNGKRSLSYRKLLFLLHGEEFTYTMAMDGNRYDDGINLRYRFADESGYADVVVAKYLDDCPCSILEMMVALAIRLEENIMADPVIGDRTSEWFWVMISNLGLIDMDDGNFNCYHAASIIKRFLNRDYAPNGEGGLFVLADCKYDLRDVEIWYQANWYLDKLF